jgi:PKD repeat protein
MGRTLTFNHILVFLAVTLLFGSCNLLQRTNAPDHRDGIEIALLEDMQSIVDPATNTVPLERLVVAKQYKDSLVAERKTRGAIPGVTWTSLGSQNQAGRSRAVHVDLNDPTGHTVWVGSVGGGLWKTTNISVAQPQWTTNTQLLSNLSISDIVQDPSNTAIMYFCTGESHGGSGAIRGLGVFKSTDSGNTWAQLASTNNSTYHWTTRMFVNTNGDVFVCTESGLYRSLNGGNTFTKVLGQGMGITGANSNQCNDIERAANGDLYCSLDGSVHKSIDGGTTWGAAVTLPISAGRIEIACAPSDANYLYLLVEFNNVVNGILRSIDGGVSYTARTEPVDSDGGIPATDFSRGQAWYDLSIAVDPSNRDALWVGGIDIFKSPDGGSTWQQQSHWYGANFQYVHADQHDILFDPFNPNKAYFVHDGGIDQTLNASAANVTTSYKGYNYNTIQFYACAMHPDTSAAYYLAGAQDNGTQQFTQDVFAPTYEVTGGDGAFCHIDQDEPIFQWTSYIYNNYRRSTDGGNNFIDVNFGNSGRFINPTDYDNVNNIMYCARNSNQYMVWTNPQTGNSTQNKTVTQFGGSQVSCITVSPNTANRVFFGSSAGKVVRVDNANGTTPVITDITGAGMPTVSYVSCIEVEVGNDQHIIAVFRNYGINNVWETTNGGTSWTAIDGNLPDMPIRWALFNPLNNNQVLLATELGVWSTDLLQGATTDWAATNSGLANVRVDMLQTRASDRKVIAATHGRGLFISDAFSDPSAAFSSNTQIAYIGQQVKFTNTSVKATTNLWSFGDGATSTAVSPTHTYLNPGIYTVTLNINNGYDIETKVDYITVMPNRTAPYSLAQGGDFESNPGDFAVDSIQGTKWEYGNSPIGGKDGTVSGARAWVTGINEAQYADNSTSYLYSPGINLAAGQSYTLQFETKFDLEFEYDGFNVEYTIDSGANWQVLGQVVQPNWYNYDNDPQVSLVFPAAQAFFNGTQSTWTPMQYDITALAGKRAAFRFAFKTDDFVTGVGVAIDNFEVVSAAGPLAFSSMQLQGLISSDGKQLSWNTCCSQPNCKYTIYASADGKTYQAIHTIVDPTNGNRMLSYTDAMQQNQYYKVEASLDGQYVTTSNIVRLSENLVDLIITPNPVRDVLMVQTGAKVVGITLLTSTGQVLATSKNSNLLQVPSQLGSGTYVCRVNTKAGTFTRKVQIMR